MKNSPIPTPPPSAPPCCPRLIFAAGCRLRIGVPGLPPPQPIRNSSAVTVRISSAAAACANSCVGHMLGPLSALTRPAIPDAGRSAAAEPPRASTTRDPSSAPPSRHASAPSRHASAPSVAAYGRTSRTAAGRGQRRPILPLLLQV